MKMNIDTLTTELLDAYQRDFPLSSRPYLEMAASLGYSESDILSKLQELKETGVVTRIGPVFDHRRAGASLLAAMQVEPEKLTAVADQINQYTEVNHNYAREHHYNLWFVVTAPSEVHLQSVLNDMEKTTGYPILCLPMEKSYHIDLSFHVGPDRGFKKRFTGHMKEHSKSSSRATSGGSALKAELLNADQQQKLRAMIQDGLPLTSEPFVSLADMLEVTDPQRIINTLQGWLDTGLIKRIGLVTNHHRIGFTSNAMVVWDVPDDKVDKVGEAFKQSGLVSLCYRRPRRLPHWPYNLFCMIHSRDRDTVADHVAQLVELCGLQAISRDVLFSTCQFKQKGGHYTRASSSHIATADLPSANSALSVPDKRCTGVAL